MGIRNYLIEGSSCAGKTTVCDELLRRGFHAIHGDRLLAYQGDPETGQPLPGHCHEHHIWNLELVRQIASDNSQPITFFCGGSRNFEKFIDWMNGVFILDINTDTLCQRLNLRTADDWGARPEERALILQLHKSGSGLPGKGIHIDANRPVRLVTDDILRHVFDQNDQAGF